MANTKNIPPAEGNHSSPELDAACKDHLAKPDHTFEQMRMNLFRAFSHDMRTPLASIIGNSLTLQENWTLLSDSEKLASIAQIYETSEWLVHMMDNLLAVARMREDGLTIHTNEELVEEVIGETLEKLGKRHPHNTIHVSLPKEYIFLPMDALLIEQAIINLLENALCRSNYTEPVDMLVENGQDKVTFTIRDYGDALPEYLLGHPFNETVYPSSHAADAQKGLGIMLATCKAIIDSHQGTLTARNHSHGAEFIFTLPKTKEGTL